MFDWFRSRKDQKSKVITTHPIIHHDGYCQPQSITELLKCPKRQAELNGIWQNSSIPIPLYHQLYLSPLYEVLSLMQQMPMSENQQYAYSGGLIDYTLKSVNYAMKLSKSYLFPPGGEPEDISSQSSVWNVVIFYASLFQALDRFAFIDVELISGKRWLAVSGIPTEPYRFKFHGNVKGLDEINSQTAMLAYQILPREALIWLAEWPEAIRSLLLFFSANRKCSGVIDTIVTDAVNAVTGQIPIEEPPLSLQPKPQLAEAMVAAPQARVSVQDNDTPVGLLFFAWLQDGLRSQQLSVNRQDDVAHIVLEFVFIQSPQIFYRYLKENPIGHNSEDDKKQLQKSFEKLGYHHRKNRKAIFTCKMFREMAGEGKFKKMNGYFIPAQRIYVADKVPAENLLVVVE